MSKIPIFINLVLLSLSIFEEIDLFTFLINQSKLNGMK
jgi:hypothetical protein